MEKCGKNLVTQTLTLTFTAPKYFNKNSYFIAIKHEKTNVADIQIRIILFFFCKFFFFFFRNIKTMMYFHRLSTLF